MSKRNGAAREEIHDDPRFVTRSVSFDPAQLDEVDAASAQLFRSNRSLFMYEAITHFLEHLRKTRNGGRSFIDTARPAAGRRNRTR
ncbi:MAG TPA: hypothetical protein VN903_36545 [Polyangia bacterium]|nr:hypothetical protein [Polyangia bacterium]